MRGVKDAVPVARRRDDEGAASGRPRRSFGGDVLEGLRRSVVDTVVKAAGAVTTAEALTGGGLPCEARQARDVAGFAGSVDVVFAGSLSLGRSMIFSRRTLPWNWMFQCVDGQLPDNRFIDVNPELIC